MREDRIVAESETSGGEQSAGLTLVQDLLKASGIIGEDRERKEREIQLMNM